MQALSLAQLRLEGLRARFAVSERVGHVATVQLRRERPRDALGGGFAIAQAHSEHLVPYKPSQLLLCGHGVVIEAVKGRRLNLLLVEDRQLEQSVAVGNVQTWGIATDV